MTLFPLNLTAQFGPTIAYLIYAVLGFGFGFILESAGFGNAKKLAAQFYFKELTVFKVMFTAIIVAMTLIFFSSAIGLLDYQLIWVNPTYLWPGILGGLIMGVGFIIGGFCPGTSLVAAATLKIDGIFFVLGALFGIFLFGDSVDFYSGFFHSSDYGRLTLTDLLSIPAGVIVIVVVIMALAMFIGAEWIESRKIYLPLWQKITAAVLVSLALVSAWLDQPTLDDRWQKIAPIENARIQARDIFASPLEVANLQNNRQISVRLLDIRSESDFNIFHIRDAERVNPSQLEELAPLLIARPGNTVFILTGNDELAALAVWKQLRAASLPNLYILDGGVNGWIRQFAEDEFKRSHLKPSYQEGELAFQFPTALGHRYPMAAPNPKRYANEYTPKVKLEIKRAPSGGGCG